MLDGVLDATVDIGLEPASLARFEVLGERIGHDVVGDLAIEESLQRSADLGARQVFAGPNLRENDLR